MTALFGRSFEVSDRRKCHRRAARVSQVKSLSHNTHGPAEALPPTAMGFGKMDKVELRTSVQRCLFRQSTQPEKFCHNIPHARLGIVLEQVSRAAFLVFESRWLARGSVYARRNESCSPSP